jgi:hypothetical protein
MTNDQIITEMIDDISLLEGTINSNIEDEVLKKRFKDLLSSLLNSTKLLRSRVT